MFYIIYKTINILNSKYYIGKHITNNLNDNYLGSGLHLKNVIKKYGKENFVKEIVCLCESEEQMNKIESLIINEDIINDKNSYNIALGGIGGMRFKEGTEQYKNWKKKLLIGIIFKRRDFSGKNNPNYNKHHSFIVKQKISEAKKGIPSKPFSNEHKLNMSKSKAKNCIITWPDGKIEQITNLFNFCKKYNFHHSGMARVARGERKTYKGILCQYAN